ncbi:hypothetical protein ACP70R_037961 [Stipagrostis hirtigluma subsp. patula]
MRRQTKVVMGKHLCKNGFTADYTRWIYHGEADRMRYEVVRHRIEEYDVDAGVGDMLNDYHDAHFDEGRREEESEATIEAQIEALEAQLEEERRRREEIEQRMEVDRQRMEHMFQWMQSIGEKMGQPMLPMPFPMPPPPPTVK